MFSCQALVFSLCVFVLIAIIISRYRQPVNLPAPTPVPTATLAPGWKRFENKGVSIALPDTFIGGSLTAADQEMIANNIAKFGDEYEPVAERIKQNPDLYLLFAMDTEQTSSGAFSNLVVAHEKVLSAVDPATYMKTMEKQLPTQFEIKARDEITLFGKPAAKLMVEMPEKNMDVTQIMYLFKRGDYMYLAGYATSSDDLDEKLPLFEQSLQTLTINPE